MYNFYYESACALTSTIIFFTSTYLTIVTHNYIIIFISISGLLSLLTRLYRIYHEEYIMNHLLVHLDIVFAILAFITFLIAPFSNNIYEMVLFAFILMIIAAFLSWDIFSMNLVTESFILQLTGHCIIAYELLKLVLS